MLLSCLVILSCINTALSRPEHVKDNYLIVLKDGPKEQVMAHLANVREMHGISPSAYKGIKGHYEAFRMYSIHTDPAVIEYIKHQDIVEEVVQEAWLKVDQGTHLVKRDIEESERINDYAPMLQISLALPNHKTQYNAPPGLARISHRLNTGAKEYIYEDYLSTNPQPTIYLFDNGCRITHREFNGRVKYGPDFTDAPVTIPGDISGHGTRVMSVILGEHVGIARSSSGVSLRVIEEDGWTTPTVIIAALDWVLNQLGPNNLKVLHFSMSIPFSAQVNRAADVASYQGMHVVASAGNDGKEVDRLRSPASSKLAIGVGSITARDTLSKFSNFGSLVEFVAPGEHVVGADIITDGSYGVWHGTSMAAPHVTGVLAYMLALHGPKDPSEMKAYLRGISTISVGSSRIIYNNSGY